MDLSQQEAQFRRNLKVQQSLSQGMSEARAAGSRHANFYIHEIIKALKVIPLTFFRRINKLDSRCPVIPRRYQEFSRD